MKKRRFTVYMSDKQHTAILALSAQAGQSMSDWISHALTEKIAGAYGAAAPEVSPASFTGAVPRAALFSDDEWEAAVPTAQDEG